MTMFSHITSVMECPNHYPWLTLVVSNACRVGFILALSTGEGKARV